MRASSTSICTSAGTDRGSGKSKSGAFSRPLPYFSNVNSHASARVRFMLSTWFTTMR